MPKRSDAAVALTISLAVHGLLLAVKFSQTVQAEQIVLERLPMKVAWIEEQAEVFEMPRAVPAPPPPPEPQTAPPPPPKPEPPKAEPPPIKKEAKKEPKKVVKKETPQPAPHQQAAAEQYAAAATQPVRPVSGTADGTSTKIRGDYRQLIAARLEKHRRYPSMARRRRIEGRGIVHITIRADGALGGVKVLESTGHEILDKEMLAMVKRAAPFPAFPVNLVQRSLTLAAPIQFQLRGPR